MMRVGLGWDLHKLVDGEFLTIGGVEIPFNKKFEAHSDGDVLVHAIIDALLGAANLGDIGTHFPPSDDKYKDIDSLVLLSKTKDLLKNKNIEIVNIDSTIIIEQPKMARYLLAMREKLSVNLELEINRISIKAKTHEKTDSTGRGEAAQAQAICLIQYK